MATDKQALIDWYQEKFADKTLSFWCLVRHEKVALRWNCIVLWWWFPAKRYVYACYNRSMDDTMSDVWVPIDGLEIIWHPLNRWLLVQECCVWIEDKVTNLVCFDLNIALTLKKMLGKTIYEWVNDAEILNILFAIKQAWDDVRK